VQLLFLILTPEAFPEQHLKTIRTIAQALQRHDMRSEMKKAMSSSSLLEYLQGLE
jgi:mannitol/fructose-specific phosphotransferase system IIA component (Ntr-type)